MKHFSTVFSFCAKGVAALALLSASAYGANVLITAGGTFPGSATTSTYTAPSGTWTLSFQVASQPVVSNVTTGEFTTTYTNGVFTLNGTPITLTGSSVTFYNGGGFLILLDPNTQFEDNSESNNFYTGATSSPTMAPATYPQQIFSIDQYPSGAPIVIVELDYNVVISAVAAAPPATPAPTSVLLVSLGLAALALLEMLRRKQAV